MEYLIKTKRYRRRPHHTRSNYRRERRPRGGRSTNFAEGSFEKLENRYQHLIEQYLLARKKYFEFFHRSSPFQVEKLKKAFHRSAQEINQFENNIPSKWEEKFKQKYRGQKLDHTYSTNHQLSVEGDAVEEKQFYDPHLLQEQLEHNFSQDKKETSGTIEDYHRYKGK